MKKTIRFLLTVFLLCTVLSAFAGTAFAFGVNRSFQVDGKSVSTLADAFGNVADTGSVIMQIGEDKTVYPTSENIVVTKEVTLITGKSVGNTIRRIEYNGNDKPLFTVANDGRLTLQYSEISLSDTDAAGNGKLIVVESGGTLVLDGTDAEPVTFSGSRDGLILVKDGGKIVFCDATFNGNPSYYDIVTEDGGVVIRDINGDRVIDGADFYRISKYLDSPDTDPLSASPDLNGDGNVDRTDLSLLWEYLTEKAPDTDAADISDKGAHSVTISPDKSAHFLFTPKTGGKYSFALPDGEGTKLWYILRDKNGNCIGCDYYGSGNFGQRSENGTFEIPAELEAGTKYYLEIGTVQENKVEFEMNISFPQCTHVSFDAVTHKCVNCGVFQCDAEGHTFAGGECTVCGAFECEIKGHEYKNGKCTVCGEDCKNAFHNNEYACPDCGMKLDPAATGSTLSEGNLTILVGIAAAVIFGLGGFFIGRGKKTALADAAQAEDE